MDNFVLFILGISITLIAGLGVVVYCVSLGYQRPSKFPADQRRGSVDRIPLSVGTRRDSLLASASVSPQNFREAPNWTDVGIARLSLPFTTRPYTESVSPKYRTNPLPLSCR